MRLTLRTLLAYMDEILESEDAEAIGKKIEESEFAAGLLHRIRDVMRRLRLGTPDVADRRAGLDANTVAEYLDNTLPHERVLDFEKVCLESDVHLAEVAACHQILALVLGEPADVGVPSRQRMYQLPELVSAQVKAATEAAGLPPAESATGSTMGFDKPTPEAARKPSGVGAAVGGGEPPPTRKKFGWWPAVAAAALVLLCGVLVLAVTGQFEPDSFLGNILGLGPGQEGLAQARDSAAVPRKSPDKGQSHATGGPAKERPTEPPGVPAPGDAPPAPSTDAAVAKQAVDSTEPVSSQGVGAPTESQPSGPPKKLSVGAGPSATAADQPGAQAKKVEPVPGEAEPDAGSPKTPPLAQPAVALAMTTPGVSTRPGGKLDVDPGGPSGPAPVPPQPVGELKTPSQVLLTFDVEAADWRRMPDQGLIVSQANYLCLPTYRPEIVLADQIRLMLADGTWVQFPPADQDGTPGLVVSYGRLTIDAPEDVPARLRLQAGDQLGVVTLAETGSRLAVEVSRASGSNVDPETQPAPLTTDLYVVSGKILWQERANAEPVTVNAPVRLRLNQQPIEAVAIETVPNWILADTIKLLDQRASATVQKGMEAGRPVILRLRELAEHRQREVRWLAVRCLGWTGDFEPMVTALDNPAERPVWRDYVDELRSAVVRGPQVAASVRSAMEKLHGDEGAALYAMLWKHGRGAMAKGEADDLVRYLDHNTLAFRRLGFWNLQRGTGGPDLFYRPEDTAAKRQAAVRKWKEWLRANSGRWGGPQDDKNQAPPKDNPVADPIVPGMDG